jgi:hypothetical protein
VGGSAATLAADTSKGEGREGVCDRTITDLDGGLFCSTSKNPMRIEMQRIPPSVAKPTPTMQRTTRKCCSRIGNRKDANKPKQPLAQTTKPMIHKSNFTAISIFASPIMTILLSFSATPQVPKNYSNS